MNRYSWLVALALGIASPAFSQVTCTGLEANYDDCKNRQRQDESERQIRERSGANAKSLAETQEVLNALRARLLALPPLAPDRNPLLGGGWQLASTTKPRGGDDLSKLMGMLNNPTGAVCEVVFGSGTTEFRAATWAANDGTSSDSLGSIQYRMQDKQVFAIPVQGLPLLGFKIVDANRIQEFRMNECELVRVAAKPATAPAARAVAPAPVAPAVVARAPVPVVPVPVAPPISAAAPAAKRPAGKPIEPNSPLGRGARLHGEKEFQSALQELLIAEKSSPDDARVYAYLSSTYDWLGMQAESKQAAERARKLDPNAFDILR